MEPMSSDDESWEFVGGADGADGEPTTQQRAVSPAEQFEDPINAGPVVDLEPKPSTDVGAVVDVEPKPVEEASPVIDVCGGAIYAAAGPVIDLSALFADGGEHDVNQEEQDDEGDDDEEDEEDEYDEDEGAPGIADLWQAFGEAFEALFFSPPQDTEDDDDEFSDASSEPAAEGEAHDDDDEFADALPFAQCDELPGAAPRAARHSAFVRAQACALALMVLTAVLVNVYIYAAGIAPRHAALVMRHRGPPRPRPQHHHHHHVHHHHHQVLHRLALAGATPPVGERRKGVCERRENIERKRKRL